MKIKVENYFKSDSLKEYKMDIENSDMELISKNLDLSELSVIYINPTVYESTS